MLTESDQVAPRNVYGRTKAEAEARVLDVKPDALVVRTNFYAWGPSYRRSFSDFILDSVRARRQVTLFHDVTYCPILAQPLVEAIHELVWRGATGVYHVVGDEEMTKLEFGRRLVRRFGLTEEFLVPCSITEKAGLVQRPHRMSLSNAKASRLLGHAIGGATEHLNLLVSLEQTSSTAEIQRL
jgi:dTDP-4-dehydrorhamnose reductase